MEEGKIRFHHVETEGQLAELGTMHLSKRRHCDLIKLIDELKSENANKLIIFLQEAIIFLWEEYLRIPHIF